MSKEKTLHFSLSISAKVDHPKDNLAQHSTWLILNKAFEGLTAASPKGQVGL